MEAKEVKLWLDVLDLCREVDLNAQWYLKRNRVQVYM